ncbi:MAG: hypothetical protein R3B93_06920 [Bacteroidia bacterium]
MTEHIFVLDNISPLEVYGVNNSRLQQIEEGFPEIKFVARGDELKIRGEEEKIEKLKSILGALFEEIKKRGRVSENRFNEILLPESHQENPKIPLAPADAVLVHGGGGLIIKPKTKRPEANGRELKGIMILFLQWGQLELVKPIWQLLWP